MAQTPTISYVGLLASYSGNTAQNSQTLTFSSIPAVGSLLVFYAKVASSVTAAAIKDANSQNTWGQVDTSAVTGVASNSAMYVCLVNSNASYTTSGTCITVQYLNASGVVTNAGARGIWVAQFSGASTTIDGSVRWYTSTAGTTSGSSLSLFNNATSQFTFTAPTVTVNGAQTVANVTSTGNLTVGTGSLPNFPPSGTFTVPGTTPTGTITISYTSISATQFQGCTIVSNPSGSTTIANSATVTLTTNTRSLTGLGSSLTVTSGSSLPTSIYNFGLPTTATITDNSGYSYCLTWTGNNGTTLTGVTITPISSGSLADAITSPSTITYNEPLTYSSELVLSGFGSTSTASTVTIPTGFTQIGSTAQGGALAYNIWPTAGSTPVQWTAGTSSTMSGITVGLLAAPFPQTGTVSAVESDAASETASALSTTQATALVSDATAVDTEIDSQTGASIITTATDINTSSTGGGSEVVTLSAVATDTNNTITTAGAPNTSGLVITVADTNNAITATDLPTGAAVIIAAADTNNAALGSAGILANTIKITEATTSSGLPSGVSSPTTQVGLVESDTGGASTTSTTPTGQFIAQSAATTSGALAATSTQVASLSMVGAFSGSATGSVKAYGSTVAMAVVLSGLGKSLVLGRPGWVAAGMLVPSVSVNFKPLQ